MKSASSFSISSLREQRIVQPISSNSTHYEDTIFDDASTDVSQSTIIPSQTILNSHQNRAMPSQPSEFSNESNLAENFPSIVLPTLKQLPVNSNIFSSAAFLEEACRNGDMDAFSRVKLENLTVEQLESAKEVIIRKMDRDKTVNQDLLDMMILLNEINSDLSPYDLCNLANYAVKLDDADALEYFISRMQAKDIDYDVLSRAALSGDHTQLALDFLEKWLVRPTEEYESNFSDDFYEFNAVKRINKYIKNEKAQNSPFLQSITKFIDKFLDTYNDPRTSGITEMFQIFTDSQLAPQEVELVERIKVLTEEWVESMAHFHPSEYQGQSQNEANRLWKLLNDIHRDLTESSPAMIKLLNYFDNLKESGTDPRNFGAIMYLDAVFEAQNSQEEFELLIQLKDAFDDWMNVITEAEEHDHKSESTEQLNNLIQIAIQRDNLNFVKIIYEKHADLLDDLSEIVALYTAAEYSDRIFQHLLERETLPCNDMDMLNFINAIKHDDIVKMKEIIANSPDVQMKLIAGMCMASKLENPEIFIYLIELFEYNSEDIVSLPEGKTSPAVMKYLMENDFITAKNRHIILDNMTPAVLGYFFKDPRNRTGRIYQKCVKKAIDRGNVKNIILLLSLPFASKLIDPERIISYFFPEQSQLLKDNPSIIQRLIDMSHGPLSFDKLLFERLMLDYAARDVFIILLKERLRGRVIIDESKFNYVMNRLQEKGYYELARLPQQIEDEYFKTNSRRARF